MARKKPDFEKVEVTESSGNIFADLGLPNPEKELARAKLALVIQETIKSRGLTQTAAAKLAGIDQAKISKILNGHLEGYSIDRLMRLLQKLGHDVEFSISKSATRTRKAQQKTRKQVRQLPQSMRVDRILEKARDVAIDYYAVTGKPLGITGEIGEYIAAKRLGLKLAPARTAGYDAKDSRGRKIQIKSRVWPDSKKLSGQRLGSIKLRHAWDDVVLVLMNEAFEPRGIYRAGRHAIETALSKPGSKARNLKGALGIRKFIQIGYEVWVRD